MVIVLVSSTSPPPQRASLFLPIDRDLTCLFLPLLTPLLALRTQKVHHQRRLLSHKTTTMSSADSCPRRKFLTIIREGEEAARDEREGHATPTKEGKGASKTAQPTQTQTQTRTRTRTTTPRRNDRGSRRTCRDPQASQLTWTRSTSEAAQRPTASKSSTCARTRRRWRERRHDGRRRHLEGPARRQIRTTETTSSQQTQAE